MALSPKVLAGFSLERNFDEACFDMIGVQEACIPCSGTLKGEIYAMYSSSSAAESSSGVQLWMKHSLSHSVVEFVPVSSRLLIVVILCADVYIYIPCI